MAPPATPHGPGPALESRDAFADVAQLVERWLPKPKVAGSRPVVRLPRSFQRAGAADSSAGPARPAARPKPPLAVGGTLPAPLLLPRQFPLLAQSHLEEHQEHDCAETEGDQRDREHFAGQSTDQDGGDRASDNERRGRPECKDARAGRHRPKVSLRDFTPSTRRAPVRGARRSSGERGPPRDRYASPSGACGAQAREEAERDGG
jgi:hypothetical protein